MFLWEVTRSPKTLLRNSKIAKSFGWQRLLSFPKNYPFLVSIAFRNGSGHILKTSPFLFGARLFGLRDYHIVLVFACALFVSCVVCFRWIVLCLVSFYYAISQPNNERRVAGVGGNIDGFGGESRRSGIQK